MPKFIAQTSRGLESVLHTELAQLGFEGLAATAGGVEFQGNWGECYRANLSSRVATRVLLPILDFDAYQPEDLYHHVKKHDFTKYIKPEQTMAVEAHVRSERFKDRRFVALKTKDAIVDQFRDRFDVRPSVAKDNPDLPVVVRVHKSRVSVAINTSGETLTKRGYRVESGFAPLREHLAAGLLLHTGWKPGISLVDPMCGSGTFLIEAALIGKCVAPGSFRKSFAFQKWQGFQAERFSQLVEQMTNEEKDEYDGVLLGSDQDGKVLTKARRNAERADVDQHILWVRKSVDTLIPPEDCEPGIIVVNPPYGERIGLTEELKDVYRDLGFALKTHFKGWTCWILSGNPKLTEYLRLKASQKIPVFNGPLECRWIQYTIR